MTVNLADTLRSVSLPELWLDRANAARWRGRKAASLGFAVAELVPDLCCSLLAGDGGSGKSILLQTMATAIAVGLPFLGRAVEQRRALYLTGEDPEGVLHVRQERINRALDITMEDVADRLFVLSMADEEFTLFAAGEPTSRLGRLAGEIGTFGVGFVAIDSAALVFDDNEIDRRAVSAFLRRLNATARLTGAAIVLISHTSRSSDGTSARMASGSTAWVNAARAGLQLKATDDGAELTLLKSNYSKRGTKIDLTWTDDGVLLAEQHATGTVASIGLASAAGLLPMLGAAGGPIGMGIGLLGSLIAMLFGGEGAPPLPPLAGSNVRFDPGAGGYTASETFQNGGASQMGLYGGVAGSINALYAATGGTLNPALATGGAVWNNQREGTTSTYAIHPTLGSVQLSEGGGDQSAAVDRMIAKMFYMTATTPGALTGISPTLTTALGNREPTSTQTIAELLSMVNAYDNLGESTNEAEQALEAIDAQFDELSAGAALYGLSLAPIKAEQAKVTTRYAQDFIDAMLDPMAVQMRALDDERKSSIASAEYIRDNVEGVYVDMARISEYWLKKEAQLKDQLYGSAVASLEAAIKRLTVGDLSNTSPTTQLSGIRAGYNATLAQARGGDAAAIGRLAGEGVGYAEAGRSYFASSPEYQALVEQIRRDLAEVQAAISAPAGTAGGTAASQAAQEQAYQLERLADQISASAAGDAELKDQMTVLISMMRSIITNRQM